jgi:hypothetical protein
MPEKHALELVEERIPVDPRIIIGRFAVRAGDVPMLAKRPELGPFDLNGEAAYLEVNGSIVARGSMRLDDRGAEFIIAEMSEEEAE